MYAFKVFCLFATAAGTSKITKVGTEPSRSFQVPSQPITDSYWFDADDDEQFEERMLASKEIKCVVSSDCPQFSECGTKKPGICSHKKLFPPESTEIGGYFVFAVIKALSNVAGIGGGGISVPIVMAMYGFETKSAVAISSFAIFITSLASFIVNFYKKHPEKPQVVLIDYNLVTIMMPLVLVGAQVGGLILVLFPSLAIQIMLTLTLIGLMIQTIF